MRKYDYEIVCYKVQYVVGKSGYTEQFMEEEQAVKRGRQLINQGAELVGVYQVSSIVGWY